VLVAIVFWGITGWVGRLCALVSFLLYLVTDRRARA
jgi:hypothetical protein